MSDYEKEICMEVMDPVPPSSYESEDKQEIAEEQTIVALLSDASLTLSVYLTLVAFRTQHLVLEATCLSQNLKFSSVTFDCIEITRQSRTWDLCNTKCSMIILAFATLKTVLGLVLMRHGHRPFDFIVLSISFHVLLMYCLFPWPSSYKDLSHQIDLASNSLIATNYWALIGYIGTSLAALALAGRHMIKKWFQYEGRLRLP